MATRIPDMRIERLKVATYLELMLDVYETCRQDSVLAGYMAQPLSTLKAQINDLQNAMEESKKSQYTSQITQKDTQRDSALVMAKTMLHNTALNGTDGQREAAKFLEEMAKLPKVKVTPQYDQQTGEITVAVNELLGKYLTYTEAAGLKTQIEQLKRLNDEMCQLIILRDTEKGAQGKSRISDIRQKLDKTYRDFIDLINSLDNVYQLGQLKDAPAQNPCQNFIDHMLGQIDRFKREILKNGGTTGGTIVDEDVVVDEEETETTKPGGSEGGGDNGTQQPGDGSEGSENNPSTPSTPSNPSNPNNPDPDDDPDALKPGDGGDDPDL